MDRQVTPPKRDTSPTWGLPPPRKQALNKQHNFARASCVFYAFLCHQLHDFNVKMPNSTYHVGRKQATTKFSLFLNLDMAVKNSTPRDFAYNCQSR